MFKFRSSVQIQIVPKPVRLERKHPKAQSPRAQRYLENQDRLAQEFWLDMVEQRREYGLEYPIVGAVSMRLIYHVVGRPHLDRANIEKAVEDALVKAGVLRDDSIRYVPDATVSVFARSVEHRVFVELRPAAEGRVLDT